MTDLNPNNIEVGDLVEGCYRPDRGHGGMGGKVTSILPNPDYVAVYYDNSVPGRSGGWDHATNLRITKKKDSPVSFNKTTVITVVMSNKDTSRSDAQKKAWLNSVGISIDEIDAIITPPVRSYDIVKCITDGAYRKVGALYSVKGRVPQDDDRITLHGIRGNHLATDFEIVQRAADR